MGKGIAYQFKEAFPKNYDIYRDACKKGDFKIGSILIVSEQQKLIVNFPSKDNWKKKSKYEYIEIGLKKLKEEITKRNIKSIAIPPLGCGNGGLEWEVVESMIIKTLGELELVDVILFAPPSKEIQGEPNNILNVKHLLVHYVFRRAINKYRYTLNAVFYICTFINKDGFFEFTTKYGRPYSKELNQVIDDLKFFKDKYEDEEKFEGFIENYINTNLTKEMEVEFRRFLPAINFCVELLNKLESKEDLISLCRIIKEISDNSSVSYDPMSQEGRLLEELLKEGLIQKNIFNELEILKF